MEPNLTFLGIIIRLMAATVWVIIGWWTSTFAFFIVGMLTIVVALTGYDPLIHFLKKKSA